LNLADRRTRVLVVDDHQDARDIAVELMRQAHFAVVATSTAAEALSKIDDLRPDLILLDFAMPGMNGVELTRLLRTHPVTREACIIMLTAFADDAFRSHALGEGCDAVVAKPYDIGELLRIVNRQLRAG
jgi:CheY-like chemotaxis protein